MRGWWPVRVIRSLLGRNRFESELDAEINSYVDLLSEEKSAAGLAEQAAQRAARMEVGVEQVKEHIRERRTGAVMEQWLQDLRYGLRMVARNPMFAAVVIVTLAIGIGATTAVFSIVDAVLLNPLPFPNADRVVTLWQRDRNVASDRGDVAPGNFLDWRSRTTAFEVMATSEAAGVELISDGEPQNLRVWRVSEGFFNVLGVPASLGRTFLSDEHRPGSGHAVVLSHGFWQRQFGMDRGALGRSLTLSGVPYTVVGIMPESFDYPPGRDLWLPRSFTDADAAVRGRTFLQVIALVRPSASADAARAKLESVSEQLAREYPATNRDSGVAVVSLRDRLVGEVRPYLILLVGGVGLVLLITCVNVANLLIARGAARTSELAVRTAIGAQRQRLFSQLFLESVVLALLGGALGIVVARWALNSLIALAPGDVPRLGDAGLSAAVLGFTLLLSCVTAVLFGMLPARQLAKVGANSMALREGPRGAGRVAANRTRRALVVCEVALALTLVTGASLLLRSFVNLLRVDAGFSAENVVAMPVFVWARYPNEAQRREFFVDTIARLQSVSGVVAAGAASTIPFSEIVDNTDARLAIEGRPTAVDERPTVGITVATAGYFEALKMQVRQGRVFGPLDGDRNTPVAVINESMARRFWPNERPLGQRLRISSGPSVAWEVVGVVADVRDRGLDLAPRPALFIPHQQYPVGSMTYVVERPLTQPGSSAR